MATNYENMRKYGKILIFVCCGLMVSLGIAKFFNIMNTMNPIDYILNIYMMYIF
jgi:hypothetical protein